MDMTRVATGIRGSREFFLLAGIFTCLLLTTLVLSAQAQGVDLPQTGQTKCYNAYNASGAEIDCAGTGQDGEIRAGVAWPEPRFTDNNDGTITDNLTGLVWLKNRNCFGQRTWTNAIGDSFFLENGECGLSDGSVEGDWRLPNINELGSVLSVGALPWQWLPEQGFSEHVITDYYWSATTYAAFPNRAWAVRMSDGAEWTPLKSENWFVWPVRGTSNGPAVVARTGQVTCSDTAGTQISCENTGQDGEIQAGAQWPAPRFTDHGNGSVTDHLTGLVWLKKANCVASNSWQTALTIARNFPSELNREHCELSDGSNPGQWRLPNKFELSSLIDYSSSSSDALPSGHPFEYEFNSHWTSSTNENARDHAWINTMHVGYHLSP